MTPAELKASFDEHGYASPVSLFGRRESQQILGRLRSERHAPSLDWDKARAATSRAYYEVASDERVLGLVTAVLGPDVLLWGATLIERGPGAVHPWHTDIESSAPGAGTASVWIGLENTTARSSLKIVPFSHGFGVTLQQVAQKDGVARSEIGDVEVTGWARAREARSGVVGSGVVDGEAVLFDGRLWHASVNELEGLTRSALLLQYATPSTPIRIPNLGRLTWPFELFRAPKPPCIVVAGHDEDGMNRTVPPPAVPGGLPSLTTWLHEWRLPLEQDAEVGWKPHPLFRGSTPAVRDLTCHASVLDPGREPHPPHRHDEEEILVVLAGAAELVTERGSVEAARGSFAFYPAGFAHTIRSATSESVTYLMFKWASEQRGVETLEHRLVPLPAPRAGTADGFMATPVLDGRTAYLRHLHAHVTTLSAGAGYEPHVDAHDVAIVLLEGSVETHGERLEPPSVAFHAGGQAHGLRSVGDGPAVYLVFELHGGRTTADAPETASFARRLARLTLQPRRWPGAVRRARGDRVFSRSHRYPGPGT